MLLYFFFPFALIISSSLGILISPIWAFAPFVWVLVIIPLIDLILPKLSKQNNKLNETKFHNLALILVLSLVFITWYAFAYRGRSFAFLCETATEFDARRAAIPRELAGLPTRENWTGDQPERTDRATNPRALRCS